MGKKTGPSVDEAGNPYDYIVVIDAGSKGSRAHLYRAKQYTNGAEEAPVNTREDEGDAEDGEESDKEESWSIEDIDTAQTSSDYPHIELVKRKKIKPGIASFVNNPKKLGSKYMGKLLDDMEKYIPRDQLARTPVFVHATGGMRLLRPEQQQVILQEICSYIQTHSDFYLPDCPSHVQTISGETEGLYSWIGLNYKYGVFDRSLEDKSTYGAMDMGGVSTQMAFEPSNIQDEKKEEAEEGYLFKVDLNYLDPQDENQFTYKIFTQSFLGGVNQAHSKYDEKLVSESKLIDPCLPKGYIKTVTSTNGEKVDIEGSSDFTQCINSLYEVLNEITVDKYCDLTDSQTTTSCLLSDSLPKMQFNVKKFIGINEFYSNLKEFLNYEDGYMRAQKVCSMSYTDMLAEGLKSTVGGDDKDHDDPEPQRTSEEICFKSAWLINVLHQGLDFPRYGIDTEITDDANVNPTPDFKVLDGFSWTLGRAVLYTFYETAQRLDNSTIPRIGYFEPSSQVFVPGGESLGIPGRPAYVVDYYNSQDDENDNDNDEGDGKDGDGDDEDDNGDAWDNVSDHRLWGSLSFLLILMIVGYLLLGKTKRQSIVSAMYKILPEKLKSRINYTPVVVVDDDEDFDDLELGSQLGVGQEGTSEEGGRDDSFDI